MIRLLTAIILVLSCESGQDKNQAEELFRRMESKVASAKTLQWRVKGTIESKQGGSTFEGSCLLADGNRVRAELAINANNQKLTKSIFSDGKESVVTSEPKPAARRQTPESLNRTVVISFSRIGFIGIFPTPGPQKSPQAPIDVEKLIDLKDFKMLVSEKVGDRNAQSVHFQITFKERPEEIGVTLWIDCETGLPLKRQVDTVLKGEKVGTFRETYEEFRVDQEIEGSKFELPK
jgi:outer membrane lipoprotein-sorting protein